MASRESQSKSADRTAPSSHTNYQYLSTPEKTDRLQHLHHVSRSAYKKINRLKSKIAENAENRGMSLDTETTSDLHQVMQEEEQEALSKFPPESFQYVFWQQQEEAASRSDKRGMRWHPAMIKWCLYLRHQSSKA